jgi:hypothetical protein
MSAIVNRIIATPGQTASELQAIAPGEKITTTRWALFRARRELRVFRGSVRRCRVTGRNAATWYPNPR